MKKLRRDLDLLLKDIEQYIVEQEKSQFIPALRYRLNLLEEKYEDLKPFSTKAGKIEEDLRFASAILN